MDFFNPTLSGNVFIQVPIPNVRHEGNHRLVNMLATDEGVKLVSEGCRLVIDVVFARYAVFHWGFTHKVYQSLSARRGRSDRDYTDLVNQAFSDSDRSGFTSSSFSDDDRVKLRIGGESALRQPAFASEKHRDRVDTRPEMKVLVGLRVLAILVICFEEVHVMCLQSTLPPVALGLVA